MKRFVPQKKKSFSHPMALSVLLCVVLLGLFLVSVNSLSAQTATQQQVSLENALQESVVQCYCIEGFYPESLQYLKDHYGIAYNSSQFFVDYQTLGKT